ncbi:MAG TPA: hypothetical protein VHF69_11035 [Candidatus Synoicihabitans sp.]|nr:hypothetical protein [Candidatus Synoicihabitans sp.]
MTVGGRITLVEWLARYSGFPWQRLPANAELLLCFAAVAQETSADAPVQNGGPIARRDTARDAALRQHELRRSRVHFKSDNSAKV